MAYYSASAGIQVATQSASSLFYVFTDHNRQPLKVNYELVEKASRMADGTMRKFVVAKKKKISAAWTMIPSGTYQASNTQNSGYGFTSDGYRGGAWMKNFYEANLFKPVLLRVAHSQETSFLSNSASTFYASPSASAYEDIWVFMTSFNYNVNKRLTLTDYVDIDIEFTEI